MRSYLITYAQNATPVHAPFFAAAQVFCKHRKAELLVIPGRYRNPTSRWSLQQETDDWWAPEVTPSLLRGRKSLCRNLKVYGDISIQPTAEHPLTGFEVFLGKNSGIFGHPKRALEVVPTGSRSPRVLWSTSACTVPNYTPSKAGAKGKAHHVIGGVVVEIDEEGSYFVRHVTAGSDGSFTDLSDTFTVDGRQPAKPALGLTMGDYHAGRECEPVLEATERLVREVKPRNIVLHVLLDFDSRNHHARGKRDMYVRRFDTVEAEVKHAVGALHRVAGWCKGAIVRVVRSNHDEAFDRWLEEADDRRDPVNAPYLHEVWARCFRERERTGRFPDAFPMEAKRLGAPSCVRFLGVDDSLKIGGVEHARHGHHGVGGSRGTPRAYARLGVKVSTGHTHVAKISHGAYTAGLSAELDHGYNHLPSGWIHAHILQYADGKRTIVIVVNGKYKGADK